MPRAKKTTIDIFPDQDPQGLDPYTVIVTTLQSIKHSQEKLDTRFDEIYGKFKEIPENYASKVDLAETKDELRHDIGTVQKEVSSIHEWIKWATRAVLGAVLVAIVTWILAGGLLTP